MTEYDPFLEIKKQKEEARIFFREIKSSFLEGLTDEEIKKRREECAREGHKEPLISKDSRFYQPNRLRPATWRNFCKYCGEEYFVHVPALDATSILCKRVDI